ncbi:MAG TPA: hypothetical protein VGQ14_01730 [Candidatus Eisenbacteria bacterium]|jgi:hypothetical protein|nr:hypothetical protein [Candidatus Eisenbacteria bacterium]
MRRRPFVRIVAAGLSLWLALSAPAVVLASTTSFDRETVLRYSDDMLRESGRQPEPTSPPARQVLRRQRPNTISLGMQAQYGVVRGNSRVADGFDQGPGYAFRFRYMLSSSAALGFSFEHQRYNSIQEPINVPGDFADSHVVITTVSAEGVFFVHREREFVPYFLGGFGFATPDVVFAEDQAARTNEGLFLVAGVGFERFVRPRVSIDASIRGHALVSNSEFTSIGEVSLGIHLYPGD